MCVCFRTISPYHVCSHMYRLLPDHNIVRLSEYCIGIDYSSVVVEVIENLVVRGWSQVIIYLVNSMLTSDFPSYCDPVCVCVCVVA